MRTNVRIFCKACAEVFDLPEPIYEFGSFCYPEQREFANIRSFFKGKEFIGCDINEGLNVDRIEDLEALTLKGESVGTAIALETMEHVENIQKAFKELYRVIKNNGILLVASPFIFPIHEVPNDYWRFTPKALAYLMNDFSVRLIGTHADPKAPHTVYGIGFKGAREKEEVIDKTDIFIKKFRQETTRPRKLSYEISLYLKGVFRGKKYIEDVRKRHLVKFDFY